MGDQMCNESSLWLFDCYIKLSFQAKLAQQRGKMRVGLVSSTSDQSPAFMSSSGSLSAASVCAGELRSRAWRSASPAGRARPRSWPWTACTCGTGPAAARRRSASRATGGRGLGPASAPPGGCCGGTSGTGGRPRRPSPWCRCQILLIVREIGHRNQFKFSKTSWIVVILICKHFSALSAAFIDCWRNAD